MSIRAAGSGKGGNCLSNESGYVRVISIPTLGNSDQMFTTATLLMMLSEIVKTVKDKLHARQESAILQCLRELGAMTSNELQQRTAINERRLQRRLCCLAENGEVIFEPDSARWRIYHGTARD